MHVSSKKLTWVIYLTNFRDEQMANIGKYNFDHPDAFDWELAAKILRQLVARKDVIIPRYNYKTCKRD